MDAAFVFEALAAVLLICALAALFGIRRVAKLEPAIVFRG
jgi:ABC-type antimicrobial peptide transport system permease subunit